MEELGINASTLATEEIVAANLFAAKAGSPIEDRALLTSKTRDQHKPKVGAQIQGQAQDEDEVSAIEMEK